MHFFPTQVHRPPESIRDPRIHTHMGLVYVLWFVHSVWVFFTSFQSHHRVPPQPWEAPGGVAGGRAITIPPTEE